MKNFWLFGLALCLSAGVIAQPKEALKRLTGTECLKHAAVGISVKQVEDGSVVAEYQPQMALAPASVTKLLSTAFALSEKGEDFRYKTRVYYTGVIRNGILEGNILIEPQGDPSLESSYFKEYKFVEPLAKTIQQAGIKGIRGKIRVNLPVNGEENIPGTWVWEDISNYYGACDLPFNYRDNLYTLELKTGVAGTKAQVVRVVPKVPGVTFRNEVRASEKGKPDVWIYGGPYSRVQVIRGIIPQNRASFKLKGAMHDPASCFVEELTDRLFALGIEVENGKLKEGEISELSVFSSPALKEIVFHTNKSSVNLFAEALGKLALDGSPLQEGLCGMLQEAGIDAAGVTLKDACGLSPLNGVPAQVFTDLLIWTDRQLGAAWVRSLPVAGVDGGLSGYYGNRTILKNNLKAKTGSFSGVRCLSGYVTTASGKRLAFTLLINHYTRPVAELQQAVGLFLEELAKS